MNADVVIAGMGPVGAVAANLAGAAGLRAVVLDRDLQPYAKPRAIVFDAEIMRVFASVGLAEAAGAASRPLGGSVYLGADLKPIRTFRSPGPAHGGAFHPSNLFYQPQLEALLREGVARFPHVDVRLGHEVRAVHQEGGLCHLTAAGPDGDELRIEAPFVIACDGASSAVRKGLGIGLDDIGFEERWLVVDTFVRGPMRWPGSHDIPDEVRDGRYSLMVCDPARPSTLIPSVGEHRRWEYMLRSDEADEVVTAEPWLKQEIGRWVDPDDVEVIRAAVYRFRALVAHRWQEGGVFLAGDAAHQTPPFFGQGMCHGVRDVAQLMWRLKLVLDGAAPPALLDAYQAEREPHVREIISASVAAGAAVCITNPERAVERDIEFRAMEAARAQKPVAMTDIVPPIRHGLVDPATGGARLPELTVEEDGRVAPLDARLGGRFTLLATGLQPPLPAELAARWRALGGREITLAAPAAPGGPRDVEGRLSAWLTGRGACAVLVRPDRYVFGAAPDASAIPALVRELLRQVAAPAPVGPQLETAP